MTKISESKLPAGPLTSKKYLKKWAKKVTAKATYSKQYRSNFQMICKIVDGTDQTFR